MKSEEICILIIIVLVAIVLTSINILYPYNFLMDQISVSEFEKCKGKELEDTAVCLTSYIKYIYNYTVRNDIPKSLENIKENGGDCYDYSNLQKQMAEELGFNGFTVRLDGHMFAVIQNATSHAYCTLEQLNYPMCYKVVNEEEEENEGK